MVVAPLIDYSGAGAAVGPVHSRDGVDYETYEIEDLDGVPTYGIDGPPALAAILACVGGFGPRPDLVLSGINHGANVGRSAMHSGTIGAALDRRPLRSALPGRVDPLGRRSRALGHAGHPGRRADPGPGRRARPGPRST